MRHHQWTASVIAITAATFLSAVAAQAQDQARQTADEPSVGLQDIIVTAQKRAEPLQDVPVSVSAFSADTLAAARVDALTGLRGLVPGALGP